MSDAASETVPAPRADTDRVGTAFAQASDVAEQLRDRAGEVADRVGDAVERASTATAQFASQVVDRIRNNAEYEQERGTTTIASEVVEKIAGIAAREVPGVFDTGGDTARAFSAIRERIGLGDGDADQGVRVQLQGKQASVHLTLVVEYGFVVYTVTEKVRAKVIGAVENLVGLEVTEVNILVDDVHVTEPGSAGGGATAQS